MKPWLLIENGVDGLLVEKDDATKMTNTILTVLKGDHPKISEKARKKVETFAWEFVKNKWFIILK